MASTFFTDELNSYMLYRHSRPLHFAGQLPEFIEAPGAIHRRPLCKDAKGHFQGHVNYDYQECAWEAPDYSGWLELHQTGMWQRAWLAHFVVLKGSNLFLLKRVESKYPTAVLSLKKSQVKPVDTVKAGIDSAWRNVIEIRPFKVKGVARKPTLVSASSTQEQSDWLEALAVAAGLLPCAGALHHTEEMAFRPMQAGARLMAERWDAEGECRLAWTIDGNEPSGHALPPSDAHSQIEKSQTTDCSVNAGAALQSSTDKALDPAVEGLRTTYGSQDAGAAPQTSIEAALDEAMGMPPTGASLDSEQPVKWAATAADNPFEVPGGDAVGGEQGGFADPQEEAEMGSTGAEELCRTLSTSSSGRTVAGRPRRLAFERPVNVLRGVGSGLNPSPDGENPQASPAASWRGTAAGEGVGATCIEGETVQTSFSSHGSGRSRRLSSEPLGIHRKQSLRERMTGVPSPAARPMVMPIVILPPRPGSKRLPPVGYSAAVTPQRETMRDHREQAPVTEAAAAVAAAAPAAAAAAPAISQESDWLAHPAEPLDAHLAFHHSDYGAAAATQVTADSPAAHREGGAVPHTDSGLSFVGISAIDAQRETAQRATADIASLPDTPPQHVRPPAVHSSPDPAAPVSQSMKHAANTPTALQLAGPPPPLHRQGAATLPRRPMGAAQFGLYGSRDRHLKKGTATS